MHPGIHTKISVLNLGSFPRYHRTEKLRFQLHDMADIFTMIQLFTRKRKPHCKLRYLR